MRHTSAALAAATALVLTVGAGSAVAAGTSDGKGAGSTGHGRTVVQCSPDKPDSKLENALRNVKIGLGANGGKLTDQIVATFAKKTGMPVAKARALLQKLFKEAPGGTKPGDPGSKGDKGGASAFSAADFAKILGVSTAKAQAALDALQKLATGPKGHIDETTPAYAAIAARLGVSPQQLTDAIIQLKKVTAKPTPGKPGEDKPAQGKDKPAPGKDRKTGKDGRSGKHGKGKPGECKPVPGKPGEPAPGKPGDGKPASGTPAPGKPGDGKPTVAPALESN
ncbi:hypothetical protein [Streptomyces brasiliensis]|uniref:Uncharacterized protein n=1 Tax=Streptomyces brasiliensis TaxID=1954 RepID=A0A917P6V1_9ACTN|nr:hypothetical protein [Streptomyces brasiliensis]GGJ64644.1 hypothetical protein GCM10010121_089140 [Streptomyces brasiliensis]